MAIAWQTGAGRAAAVAVLAAEITIDTTPLGRLADLHTGGRVDLAQATATATAIGASSTIDAGAAVGAAGRRVRAQAECAG
jgi:hypothetical protein